MIFDLEHARKARKKGSGSLLKEWIPTSPQVVEDFRVGDKVKFRDGKTGTILCFGASSMRGPLLALVAVNGVNYTCPISELRSA